MARDLVPCPSCHQLVQLDTWHPCCCGVYRLVTRAAQHGRIEVQTVPRAVATPSGASWAAWGRHRA